jgi:hypothetical protein
VKTAVLALQSDIATDLSKSESDIVTDLSKIFTVT